MNRHDLLSSLSIYAKPKRLEKERMKIAYVYLIVYQSIRDMNLTSISLEIPKTKMYQNFFINIHISSSLKPPSNKACLPIWIPPFNNT